MTKPHISGGSEAARRLGEGLRRRGDEIGLKQAEIARRTNLSAERYGHYVRGEREPDFDTLLKICSVLRTTPDGLLEIDSRSTAGPRLATPDEGQEMVTRDGNGTPKGKDERSHLPPDDDSETIRINEIDNAVINADREGDVGVALAAWEVPTSWLLTMVSVPAADHLRIVTINDDRMEETLNRGDKVLVDTSRRDPHQAGIYLVNLDGALVAQRLQYLGDRSGNVLVISDNRHYPEPERMPLLSLSILGRVIARWHPIG